MIPHGIWQRISSLLPSEVAQVEDPDFFTMTTDEKKPLQSQRGKGMSTQPRAAGRDQSPRHGLHVQHVGVVQNAAAAITPAVDHNLMTDGGSGI